MCCGYISPLIDYCIRKDMLAILGELLAGTYSINKLKQP
jgi:hypothetical protein